MLARVSLSRQYKSENMCADTILDAKLFFLLIVEDVTESTLPNILREGCLINLQDLLFNIEKLVFPT